MDSDTGYITNQETTNLHDISNCPGAPMLYHQSLIIESDTETNDILSDFLNY